MRLAWETNDAISAARRISLPPCQPKTRVVTEFIAPILFGACAAAIANFVDLKLRIPGHAVVKVVFPMALGLALAPRRCVGSIMGASAFAATAILQATGAGGIGAGAITSLCLTGPLLDLTLARAKQGWRLYAAFALAGLASNLAAFVVRGGTKILGLSPGTRPIDEWWRQAIVTYSVCGLLAGLVSAAVWFRFRLKKIEAE